MLMGTEPIRIHGLKDLQAALKAADGESQKQLRVAMNKAAEIVVDDARRRVPSRTGRLRASYRAQSGQRDAKVVAGSTRVPYAGWMEWGGSVGRNKSVKRPRVSESRYMGAAFKANYKTIVARLEEAIVDVARNAGFDVGR